MTNIIPDSHLDLIEGPLVVTLATIMPNGQPHTSVIWCRYEDGTIRFSTSQGTQKDKNLRRNPYVSMLAVDTQNPNRYLEVRGKVIEQYTEDALAELDKITQLYTGKPSYYGHIVPQKELGQRVHIISKIKPLKIITR